MNLPLILAWRYLKNSKGHAVNTLMLISFLSIMISSCLLLLVISVMNGFEKATYQQLKSIHADLIITSEPNTSLNMTKIDSLFSKEFINCRWSPSSSEYVIVACPTYNTVNTVVLLKAIDPIKEQYVSTLERTIITPKGASLNKTISGNHIIMGEKLAQTLDATINTTITILYNSPSSFFNGITLEQENVHLNGIFKTGSDEFDAYVVYCSFDLMEALFPGLGVTQINIKLSASDNSDLLKHLIEKRCGLSVSSWRDLYPSLLSALMFEKYALSFILSLICLMAILNIIAVLFVLIRNKKRDVAILKTLGLNNHHIKIIFLTISIGISMAACLIGLLIGGLLGLLIQRYPLFELPTSYIVSYIPIHFQASFFYLIFIYIVISSLLVSYISIRKVTDISITDVLRFEG